MKTHLLVIDPQNDFCDLPRERLPVVRGQPTSPALAVPGAFADLQRLAGFLTEHAARIGNITVTLDSHPSVAVERTSFWQQGDGRTVAPFTPVTAEDVGSARFVPRDASLRADVLAMLTQLEAAGRGPHMVWPVHCVTGTWGHNLVDVFAEALHAWEAAHQKAARRVLKGEYPLAEHYGVFQAEVERADVPETLFNESLARHVTEDVDLLLVAGEASSHCVSASLRQLLGRLGAARPRIVVLTDCMSPVTGFEEAANAYFDAAAKAGELELMTAPEAGALLVR